MKIYGKFEIAHSCVECDKEVSCNDRFYNQGCCPYCGHKGAFAGTIMDTNEKPFQWVQIAPWWKIWKERYYKEFKVEDGK